MIDAATRRLVRRRAGERCEYCGIHQRHEPFYRLHIDHVIPKQHRGRDHESNLALACYHCNLHKGPNLSGIDSGQVTPLFNPRNEVWGEHFVRSGSRIEGLTAVGRTTVSVLAMNAPVRLELRAELIANAESL